MAWICEQEGIEADPEALAVLAAAGEGSVRDSLSALDQAIACCGAKLNAAEVRALLGAFSLESLEKVTAGARRPAIRAACSKWSTSWSATARTCSTSAANSRATSAICWWRASPARIAACWPPATRSASSMAQIAAQFSEEDLTRYLPLSLDLFSDLQASLQPRFHLEIGLVRLVQAGRLVSIEEALGGTAPAPSPASAAARRHRRLRPRRSPRRRSAPPPRTGLRPSNWTAPRRPARVRPSRSPPAPTRSRPRPNRRR